MPPLVSAAPNDAHEGRRASGRARSEHLRRRTSPLRRASSGEIHRVSDNDVVSGRPRRPSSRSPSARPPPRASGDAVCEDTVGSPSSTRVAPSETHWVERSACARRHGDGAARAGAAHARPGVSRADMPVSRSFRLTVRAARGGTSWLTATGSCGRRRRPGGRGGGGEDPSSKATMRRRRRYHAAAGRVDTFTASRTRAPGARPGVVARRRHRRRGGTHALGVAAGRGVEQRPRRRGAPEASVVGGAGRRETSSRENRDESDLRRLACATRKKTTKKKKTAAEASFAFVARRPRRTREVICAARPTMRHGVRDPGFVRRSRRGDALRPGTRVEYELTDDFGRDARAATATGDSPSRRRASSRRIRLIRRCLCVFRLRRVSRARRVFH